MSNLVKISDYRQCPTLTKYESEIVLGHNTKRIEELGNVDIAKALKNAIGEAILVLGNKSLTEQDILMMVKQLTEYLVIKNQYSRIGDLLNAIKLGSFGEYKKENDVLYISGANIIDWFRKYEDTKRESLKKQIAFEQDEIEQEMIEKNDSESRKRYYKNLPKYISQATIGSCKMGWSYYEFLLGVGLLKLDSEEANVILRNAKAKVIAELRTQRKNIKKIGEEAVMKMAKKKAKEMAFFHWLEENAGKDIEGMVKKEIEKL